MWVVAWEGGATGEDSMTYREDSGGGHVAVGERNAVGCHVAVVSCVWCHWLEEREEWFPCRMRCEGGGLLCSC